MIDPKTCRNILAMLERVPLNGNEALAYTYAVMALHKEIETAEPPGTDSDPPNEFDLFKLDLPANVVSINRAA